MCGSGTIPLEAAHGSGCQAAPGIARNFGFERLLIHDATQWERQREAAKATQVAAAPSAIYASDRDPAMVEIAQRTFEALELPTTFG